jgi:hypothetical protein
MLWADVKHAYPVIAAAWTLAPRRVRLALATGLLEVAESDDQRTPRRASRDNRVRLNRRSAPGLLPRYP